MSKKDYERAATIAQWVAKDTANEASVTRFVAVVDAFVALFKGDNCRFDEGRFRFACTPGRNVKARTAHLHA